ncbi:FAD-binding protein [Spirillospora sp. NPDC000708]
MRHDLAVSVRSGGHSPLGHGTNTGGMVIDLSRLATVEILEPSAGSCAWAVARPGARWPGRSIRTAGVSPPATPRASAPAG